MCVIFFKMLINEIYNKYHLFTGLKEHMVRVGSVVKQICNHSKTSLPEVDYMIEASLLHDMGNLLKSKPGILLELYEPEGQAYWLAQKEAFSNLYGADEDIATKNIINEIGVSAKTLFYYNAFGHLAAYRVSQSGTLAEKIISYSDLRVGPYGVISLDERFSDIRKRYLNNNELSLEAKGVAERQAMFNVIEEEIFFQSELNPSDIHDKSIDPISKELWKWKLLDK
jgi:hypothetical protein